MNTLNTLKIFESFDELCLLLGTLKRTGHLSAIERDLSLEKLRNMYSQLMGLEVTEQDDENIPEAKKEVFLPSEVNVKQAEEIKEKIDEVMEVSMEKVEKVVSREHSEVRQEVSMTEEDKAKNLDILSDRYAGSKKSRNEFISEQHPSSAISGQQHLKPITDISKAIGLNDKFLFINELFKGDSMLYKQVIEQLNNAGNSHEAMEMIQQKFTWNMKDETTMKFLEIIKRKFL